MNMKGILKASREWFVKTSLNISEKLAKPTGFGYIVIYVSMWILFALVFTFAIPSHFYHSTAKHEAYLNNSADKLLRQLKGFLVSNTMERENKILKEVSFNDYVQMIPYQQYVALALAPRTVEPPRTIDMPRAAESPRVVERAAPSPDLQPPFPADSNTNPESVAFVIDVKQIELSELKVIDDYILITVRQTTRSLPEDKTTQCKYIIRSCITCSAYGTTRNDDHPAPRDADNTYIPITTEGFNPALNRCGQPTPFLFSKEHGLELEISKSLRDELTNFIKAVNGFPSKTEGGLGRMLYLSAVTITTVGYGDIVPLTWQARACVTIESILGVALFGLFINAVAHEVEIQR